MTKQENPFIINRYEGGEYFCDREEETRLLTHQLVNGRDVGLISPRRLGKTGLIRHLFEQEEIKEKYYTFFIDIYSTSSLGEMVYLLGKAIYEQLKPKKSQWADRFFQIISSLRAGVKLDGQTGMPVLELGLGEIKSPTTTLDELFTYLGEADCPCIVAIDEFQQILNYPENNVEALLRTKIQQCPNVHWIYAGSQRHLLEAMFASYSRPFYQSAMIISLGALPLDKYASFCRGHFERRGKKLREGVVEEVYRAYQGSTGHLQLIMNELYALTAPGGECTSDMIAVAKDNIIHIMSEVNRQLWSSLSAKQKGVMQAIAREGRVDGVTSGSFIAKYGLGTASSVQAALKKLVDRDLVVTTDGETVIQDFFLAEWIRKYY